MNKDQQFFFDHAGYSYDPKTETPEQGRERCERCAARLADAEMEGRRKGLSFQWSIDDIDSTSFTDEKPSWRLYQCVCTDRDGEVLASLGGIDLGRNGDYSDPYCRVVEAELAMEAI
jgi:hypothetical protein